ncbi:hypothetical protein TGVAND_320410 [Toxoplasma gondii VAND]|uniref:Uncharacterized protein n=1 Tax=Toxoplasma gondii VAND TaxID=933077 RepID=A0A086PU52_TOXGO|nr:hypothetical protein TGVAND_320410 [Toxoplasma gondii VAND]
MASVPRNSLGTVLARIRALQTLTAEVRASSQMPKEEKRGALNRLGLHSDSRRSRLRFLERTLSVSAFRRDVRAFNVLNETAETRRRLTESFSRFPCCGRHDKESSGTLPFSAGKEASGLESQKKFTLSKVSYFANGLPRENDMSPLPRDAARDVREISFLPPEATLD